MSADDAAFLVRLPGWAFAFALLIARLGSACLLLPGIGEAERPATLRAGFAVTFPVVLLPVLAPDMPAMPGDMVRLAAMVGAEIITGLWLGWLTRLVLLALPVAGQIAASMVGLANIIQPDPALGPQTAVLSRALGLAAPVALLASGLHALPIAALVGSYRLIPAGTLLPAADTALQVTAAMSDAFGLALRLAAPFLLAGILWQVAMALVTRLVPQVQVHFAALPGQILIGLALIGLLATAMLATWLGVARDVLGTLPGL